MHTPVPGIERLTTQDIELNGQTIQAGTRIMVCTWGLHNNPHVWEEPSEFRPERFSLDNVVKMDHFQVSHVGLYHDACIRITQVSHVGLYQRN